jgi:hypothetical protein
MRTIDPGNVGGDVGSWPFLLSMLAVTAGGILVFSTLIGVITSGINDKLTGLGRGRSFLVERGHTVIFGWSPEIFSVITDARAVEQERRGMRSDREREAKAWLESIAEVDRKRSGFPGHGRRRAHHPRRAAR